MADCLVLSEVCGIMEREASKQAIGRFLTAFFFTSKISPQVVGFFSS